MQRRTIHYQKRLRRGGEGSTVNSEGAIQDAVFGVAPNSVTGGQKSENELWQRASGRERKHARERHSKGACVVQRERERERQRERVCGFLAALLQSARRVSCFRVVSCPLPNRSSFDQSRRVVTPSWVLSIHHKVTVLFLSHQSIRFSRPLLFHFSAGAFIFGMNRLRFFKPGSLCSTVGWRNPPS